MTEIKVFTDTHRANILRQLFDRKELWENRDNRGRGWYRNAEWWTLGSALYLDGQLGLEEYILKVNYFNPILKLFFGKVIFDLVSEISNHTKFKIDFLSSKFPVGFPGFHIFGPGECLSQFFGKMHSDHEYLPLLEIPSFPFKKEDILQHYSFTYILKLPYLGGGLMLENDYLQYREGILYLHDGNFKHAIAPYNWPVLPFDWRITIQGHGLLVKDTIYYYW